MPDNSRIEDLRKRYHENPRRFFAPLANEYRKAGLHDRALLLCQKHVAEQPENMNGLVVFGQTLFEMQQLDAARMPFEQALQLDPENLIALRHLGDIARLLGDVHAAKTWYGRVLELDRRNDEVIELLAQLGGGDAATSSAAPPPRPSTLAGGIVSVASTVTVSGGGDFGIIELDAPPSPPVGKGGTVVIDAQALANRDRADTQDRTPAPDAASAGDQSAAPTVEIPQARPGRRASLLDISFEFNEPAEPTAVPSLLQAPVRGTEAAAPGSDVEALIETTGDVVPFGLEPTIGEAAPLYEAPAPAGDRELADFSAEVSPLAGLEATEFTSEQVAPLAELDSPDVTQDGVPPLAGLSTDAPIEERASTRPRMTKADLASLPLLADFGLEEDLRSPADADAAAAAPAPAPLPPAPQPLAEPVAEPVAEPLAGPVARAPRATPAFVTETMAALYVQQGLFANAIDVYSQLVAASPGDAGLRAKLTELERMHGQATAPVRPAADEMPEFEEPTTSGDPVPAPANAAMHDVSFGDIGLRGQGAASPVLDSVVPTGPTARDFFGGFARRAAVLAAAASPLAAVAVSRASVERAAVVLAEGAPAAASAAAPAAAAGWPLDAVFGAADDVRDLHAAETLAGIGTFAGPDGGTGIGELVASRAAPRRSVPRISQTLNFDQFFQQPGTASSEPPQAEAAPPGGDDLDQFQGWLKGLRQ